MRQSLPGLWGGIITRHWLGYGGRIGPPTSVASRGRAAQSCVHRGSGGGPSGARIDGGARQLGPSSESSRGGGGGGGGG
jgi:hypothetical protein